MNDTILIPRQKYILNLINQSEGLLREEIKKEIQPLIEQIKFANETYFR